MQKGTKHTPETIEIIRKGMRNKYKKMSPAERKKRMQAALRARWHKK